MYFIEGPPSTHGCNDILVVVDCLSKYGHFIPIKHPYSAAKVVYIFIQEIFHLHDIPATVIGTLFLSVNFGTRSSKSKVLNSTAARLTTLNLMGKHKS